MATSQVETLVAYWRLLGNEPPHGADRLTRVRDAARARGFLQAAAELERQVQAEGASTAVLRAVAQTFRERTRPAQAAAEAAARFGPEADAAVRKEQALGLALAYASCATALAAVVRE